MNGRYDGSIPAYCSAAIGPDFLVLANGRNEYEGALRDTCLECPVMAESASSRKLPQWGGQSAAV